MSEVEIAFRWSFVTQAFLFIHRGVDLTLDRTVKLVLPGGIHSGVNGVGVNETVIGGLRWGG